MEDKNGNSLWIVIIFVVLIIFIIFLPDIKDLLTNSNVDTTISEKSNKLKKKPEESNFKMYEYVQDMEISNGDIWFRNINYENGMLSLNTNNISDKYYIELYSGSNKFLKRYLITSNSFSVECNVDFSNIAIVKKTINDYPVVDVKDNKLICYDQYAKYEFNFIDDKLNDIVETVNVANTDNNYQTLKDKYKNKSLEANLMDGINSSFQEDLMGFSYLTKYDLKNSFNNDKMIYQKDTLAKEIKFEAESMNYKCE